MLLQVYVIGVLLLFAISCTQTSAPPHASSYTETPRPHSVVPTTETHTSIGSAPTTQTAVSGSVHTPSTTVCDIAEFERYKELTMEHHTKRQRAFNRMGELFVQMGRDSSIASDPDWRANLVSSLSDMEEAANLMADVPRPLNYKLRMAHDALVESAQIILNAIPVIRKAVGGPALPDASLLERATDMIDHSVNQLAQAYRYADEWNTECR